MVRQNGVTGFSSSSKQRKGRNGIAVNNNVEEKDEPAGERIEGVDPLPVGVDMEKGVLVQLGEVVVIEELL